MHVLHSKQQLDGPLQHLSLVQLLALLAQIDDLGVKIATLIISHGMAGLM